MLDQPELVGLAPQLLLVRAGAGDEEAASRAPRAITPGHRLERELEALLVDEAADQQHELLVRRGELGAQAVSSGSSCGRRSPGSIPFGITLTRSSSTPKMSAICSRM